MKGNVVEMIGEGAMSLAMIAAVILAGFGIRLAIKGGDRKRGILMILAAAVLIANVVILTI